MNRIEYATPLAGGRLLRSAIRPAHSSDVAELVRLVNLAYRVEDFFVNGNRTSEDDVRARLARPDAAFLVLDDGEARGRLAGAVYTEIRRDRGYLGMLSVEPSRQRTGIGAALLAAVEARCRAAGCRWLDLDVVNLREELPAFYARFGFVATGETAPFPDPSKLSRPAHLVILSKVIGERAEVGG